MTRAAKPSPTERTLKRLREMEYIAAVVEKWNPYARVRHDLFGWIDVLAYRPDCRRILGIQATTNGNAAARVRKVLANKKALAWMESGNDCEVWGWGAKKQGRKKLWYLRRRIMAITNGRPEVVFEVVE